MASTTEAYFQELRDLLAMDGNGNAEDKTARLQALAGRVGASTIDIHKAYGEASVPQLAQNITAALQSRATIENMMASRKLAKATGWLAALTAVLAAATAAMAFFTAQIASNSHTAESPPPAAVAPPVLQSQPASMTGA